MNANVGESLAHPPARVKHLCGGRQFGAMNCLDLPGQNAQASNVIEANKCVAVIPCFNEAGNIAAVVGATGRHVARVLVVDDGSTDSTGMLAGVAGALVLTHGTNCGKGAALRSGLARALEWGFVWAVTLDGDGQHSPEDVPNLVRCAEATGARLVIGNRMGEAARMPWLRRHVNQWMSRQLSVRAGTRLPDTQSGFRLLHLPTWQRLPLQTSRFEAESETLLAFLEGGHRVEFTPVRQLRAGRPSRIRPVADTVRWMKWWVGRRPVEVGEAASTTPSVLAVPAKNG